MKQQQQQQSLWLAGTWVCHIPLAHHSSYGAPCIIFPPMLVSSCIIVTHPLQSCSCPTAVLQLFLCMHHHGQPPLAWHKNGMRGLLAISWHVATVA
jgi:hypothetical protein